MKKLILASIALVLSKSTFASTSYDHIFMCKVVSFDKKELKGQCDPSKPKNTMIIPREWIAAEDVIKINKRVKFIIDDKQYDQWLAMNNLEMPKRKAK